MELTSIVLLIVLVVALVYFVMLYNQLVQIKHNVSKAWANIDVRTRTGSGLPGMKPSLIVGNS